MAKAVFERNPNRTNVGTIGHVTTARRPLTAAITLVQVQEGLATFKSYRRSGQGLRRSSCRRDATKILTIATPHVEYGIENAPRPRGLPGPRRLRQEHDHGRAGPDGRMRSWWCRLRDGPMPQTQGSTSCWPAR